MKKKKIVCLFLMVALVLIFASCHSRKITDIKPTMTKEQVISLWGATNRMYHKNADGFVFEVWEYHFESSDSICSVIFVQERVARVECRPE